LLQVACVLRQRVVDECACEGGFSNGFLVTNASKFEMFVLSQARVTTPGASSRSVTTITATATSVTASSASLMTDATNASNAAQTSNTSVMAVSSVSSVAIATVFGVIGVFFLLVLGVFVGRRFLMRGRNAFNNLRFRNDVRKRRASSSTAYQKVVLTQDVRGGVGWRDC
jgi:hypothetical protein